MQKHKTENEKPGLMSWVKFPYYFYCFHFIFNSLPFYLQFYIQSTDYDRTIMSAQSYLSGLFPPTSSQIWNPELLWQPIPVHILQKSTDRVSTVWTLPVTPQTFPEAKKRKKGGGGRKFKNIFYSFWVQSNRKHQLQLLADKHVIGQLQ